MQNKRRTNRDVYPIAAAFEEIEVPDLLKHVHQIMASNIGEYEHGEDVSSVHAGLTLSMYAAVCVDVLEVLIAIESTP